MRSRAVGFLAVCGLLVGVRSPALAQWVQTSGPEECCVKALAVDGPRVFAIVEDHGLFVSRDAGANWIAVTTGLPRGQEVSCIEAIDRWIFVGTESGLASFSDDGGANWRQIAIQKSKSWGEVTSFELLGATLFIGRADGLFACQDFAGVPAASAVALPGRPSALALTSLGPDVYVGGNKEAVFRGTEGGRGWTFKKLKFPKNNWPRCLTAVGPDLFAHGLNGIFRSSDNGASWTAVASAFPRPFVVVTFMPVGPDTLVILANPKDPTDNAVARITKGDGPESKLTTVGLNSLGILCSVSAGKKMLAGALNGIYQSLDGGKTWTRAGSGLPVASCVGDLAAIGRRLYASTSHLDWGAKQGNLYVSQEDGGTWAPISSGLPSHSTVARLAVIGPNLFAGLNSGRHSTTGKGVYLSKDEGKTWNAVNTGLPPGQAVEDLAVIGQTLYARMRDGIFVSKDLGASWVPCNEGLPWHDASCLVAGGEELFLGLCVYGAPEPGPSPLAAVLSLLAGGQNLYAGGPPPAGLLYFLPKGGARWKFTHIRFSEAIRCMAKIGDSLFIGNLNGLYVSKNYAGSEKPIKLAGESGFGIRCLAAAGPNLAMSLGSKVSLVKSVGGEWRLIDTGLPAEHPTVTSLIVTEAGLFAGTEDSGVWRLPRAELERLLQ